ncbi:MAG: sigma-70 family RNA polymerase sigma factor [Planctomycetota bacterium]
MDSAEFRELALAEMDAVYRMAMHLARHPDEAADLVQETYLKAMKAEERFELRGMGVRPWLFRILHNNFYSRIEKRKRQPTLGDDLPEVEVDGHVGGEGEPAWDLASLDWEQVDDRLKAAVNELPDHYREVLLLWAVEGLKYREIADVLGVALGTVMSRLYRARAILTEKLADLAEEHGMTVQPRSASA